MTANEAPKTTWWEIHIQQAALACRDHLPNNLSESQKDELNVLFSRVIREHAWVIQDKAFNYGFDSCGQKLYKLIGVK